MIPLHPTLGHDLTQRLPMHFSSYLVRGCTYGTAPGKAPIIYIYASAVALTPYGGTKARKSYLHSNGCAANKKARPAPPQGRLTGLDG